MSKRKNEAWQIALDLEALPPPTRFAKDFTDTGRSFVRILIRPQRSDCWILSFDFELAGSGRYIDADQAVSFETRDEALLSAFVSVHDYLHHYLVRGHLGPIIHPRNRPDPVTRHPVYQVVCDWLASVAEDEGLDLPAEYARLNPRWALAVSLGRVAA